MQPSSPSLAGLLSPQQRAHHAASPTKRGAGTPHGAAAHATTPHAHVATPSRSVAAAAAAGAATPQGHAAATYTPIHGPRHHLNFLAVPPDGGGAAAPPHTSQAAAVSVVAPGAGTGINGAVYTELGRDPRFVVDIVGRSRAPYDCYPEWWQGGKTEPNLASFAEEVLQQGWVDKSHCLIFGSRGGQVILPYCWERKRESMPPVVCINGGCAMSLPRPVNWPASAVSFLLIGGQDNFRGAASVERYIAETQGRVPPCNGTTAILYVQEMQHMPQAPLLRAVLPLMLQAVLSWKAIGVPPREELRLILAAVSKDGWSGRLLYTQGPGDWATAVNFAAMRVEQHQADAAGLSPPKKGCKAAAPIELSKQEELGVLLRAAACQAQPGGGVPVARPGSRAHAAAQAAAPKVTVTDCSSPCKAPAAPAFQSIAYGPASPGARGLPPTIPAAAFSPARGQGPASGGASGRSPHSPYGESTPASRFRGTPISQALGMAPMPRSTGRAHAGCASPSRRLDFASIQVVNQ